jgi:hypothetical protein
LLLCVVIVRFMIALWCTCVSCTFVIVPRTNATHDIQPIKPIQKMPKQ